MYFHNQSFSEYQMLSSASLFSSTFRFTVLQAFDRSICKLLFIKDYYMERQKRTIEYRFRSNQFPMPTNLKYSKLFFYRSSDAEAMLDKCWDDEAMEIIVSFNIYGKQLYELIERLPYKMKFLRIISIADRDSFIDAFMKKIKSLKYLERIEIYAKDGAKTNYWKELKQMHFKQWKIARIRAYTLPVTSTKQGELIPQEVLKKYQKPVIGHSIQILVDHLRHLPKIQEWKAIHLFLEKKKQGRQFLGNLFLSLAQEINFSELRVLSFLEQEVESIESLSRIRAPFLQKIDLSHNNITCLTSLQKIQSKNLYQLDLSHNRSNQSQNLTKLDCYNLQRICFHYAQGQDPNKIEDLTFLSKITTSKIKRDFRFEDSTRILNRITLKSLEKKNFLMRTEIYYQTIRG